MRGCRAAYKFIGVSLNATPAQLGSIMLTRALVQALSSPLGGLLGDRMDRTHIVAFGCVLWGAMTAGIGLSHTLAQVLGALSLARVHASDIWPQYISEISTDSLLQRCGLRGKFLRSGMA